MTILDRQVTRGGPTVSDGSGAGARSSLTLVELLRRRADEQPDGLAYASLDDGGRDGRRLSYAELDRSARRIAAWLQATREPGDRALLLLPAGLDVLEAFFGCLYAGIIAIPAPPPEASRLKRTLPRLRAIAADAGVPLVITQPGLAPLIAGTRDVPGLEGVECLDIRSIPADFDGPWHEPRVEADDLAYLQYTSGSTTSPKGVMISHRNVVHHCGYLRRCGEYTPESVSLTWLPYFHDYGLIEGLMEPLYNGTPGYVMSPFAFLKRPSQWLQALSRLRATHTQAPNFAYDLCVRRARPDQLEGLDLSGLRSAGNGAEPINPRVLEAFCRTFAPYGFRREAFCPAYGLAEATLMVSCCSPSMEPAVGRFRAEAMAGRRVVAADPDDATAREVASCGRVVGEFDVAIVDPDTATRCDDGQVGEIWLRDPSVARGYWRRDAETEATFGAVLADTGEGPYLRTGDLGFLRDGELYVTSRIKDLIIVAGANHHPQDIEWSVERCDPDIRPGGVSAFAVTCDGEERLAIAAEVERGATPSHADATKLLDAIRRAVAEEHEVPVHAAVLLNRGSLPKTASGKVQRHGCGRLLDPDCPDALASWVAGVARLAPSQTSH